MGDWRTQYLGKLLDARMEIATKSLELEDILINSLCSSIALYLHFRVTWTPRLFQDIFLFFLIFYFSIQ